MPEITGGFNTLYLAGSQTKANISLPAITKGYREKLPTP